MGTMSSILKQIKVGEYKVTNELSCKEESKISTKNLTSSIEI